MAARRRVHAHKLEHTPREKLRAIRSKVADIQKEIEQIQTDMSHTKEELTSVIQNKENLDLFEQQIKSIRFEGSSARFSVSDRLVLFR